MKRKAYKPPRHRIQHGSLEWTGKTHDECERQRDAFLDVRFADASSCVPLVIHAGHTIVGVVFQRDTGDYDYAIVEQHKVPPYVCRSGAGSGQDGGWSRKEAEHHCRRHMAQWIYDPYGHDGLVFIAPDDTEGLEAHRRWIAFQRAYHRLEQEQPKISVQERHRLACEQSWEECSREQSAAGRSLQSSYLTAKRF